MMVVACSKRMLVETGTKEGVREVVEARTEEGAREVVETGAEEGVREVDGTRTKEGVMLRSWREVVEIPGRTVDLLEGREARSTGLEFERLFVDLHNTQYIKVYIIILYLCTILTQ